MFDTFDRTGTAEFPFPKVVVFRALKEAVSSIDGWKVQRIDDLASHIDLTTGVSMTSWGEKVAIAVHASGEQAAAIAVQSGSKTVFGSAWTHGKNRGNVRVIIEKTSDILQQRGAQWRDEAGLSALAAAPAPAAVSFADELAKLAALRDQGILNDAEFNAQKARILGA